MINKCYLIYFQKDITMLDNNLTIIYGYSKMTTEKQDSETVRMVSVKVEPKLHEDLKMYCILNKTKIVRVFKEAISKQIYDESGNVKNERQ